MLGTYLLYNARRSANANVPDAETKLAMCLKHYLGSDLQLAAKYVQALLCSALARVLSC